MIRNHDYRHSHASFLVSKGLGNGEGKDYIFFTLMKRLGHSSINTTINIYSHLFPTQEKEVANAFDNFSGKKWQKKIYKKRLKALIRKES